MLIALVQLIQYGLQAFVKACNFIYRALHFLADAHQVLDLESRYFNLSLKHTEAYALSRVLQ